MVGRPSGGTWRVGGSILPVYQIRLVDRSYEGRSAVSSTRESSSRAVIRRAVLSPDADISGAVARAIGASGRFIASHLAVLIVGFGLYDRSGTRPRTLTDVRDLLLGVGGPNRSRSRVTSIGVLRVATVRGCANSDIPESVGAICGDARYSRPASIPPAGSTVGRKECRRESRPKAASKL
jgi:hypothetical protein